MDKISNCLSNCLEVMVTTHLNRKDGTLAVIKLTLTCAWHKRLRKLAAHYLLIYIYGNTPHFITATCQPFLLRQHALFYYGNMPTFYYGNTPLTFIRQFATIYYGNTPLTFIRQFAIIYKRQHAINLYTAICHSNFIMHK